MRNAVNLNAIDFAFHRATLHEVGFEMIVIFQIGSQSIFVEIGIGEQIQINAYTMPQL